MAIPHDACDPASALYFLHGPAVGSEIECAKEAQELIANTRVRPMEGEEYLKLICSVEVKP